MPDKSDRSKMMTFRLTDLAEPLNIRGGPSMRVLRLLVNRYLWLLARAKQRFEFSEAEGLTLCYTLREYQGIETRMVLTIWAVVLDECGKGLGQPGISCEALTAKLQSLDDVGLLAVMDSVEIFWLLLEGTDAEKVRKCGLVKEG